MTFKIDKTTRNRKFDGLVGRVQKNMSKNSELLNEIALSTRRRINSLITLYNEANDKNVGKLIYKAIELEEKAAIDLGFILEYEKFSSNRVRTKTTLPISRLGKIWFSGDPNDKSEIFFNKKYSSNDTSKVAKKETVTKDKTEGQKSGPVVIIKPANNISMKNTNNTSTFKNRHTTASNGMIINKGNEIQPRKDNTKFLYIPNEYLAEFEKCLLHGGLYVAGKESLPNGSPNNWRENNGLVGFVISIAKDRMRIRAKSSFYNYSGAEDYTYYFGNNKDLDRLIMSQFMVPLYDSNNIVRKYSHIDNTISPRRNYLSKIRNSNIRDFDNPKLYLGRQPIMTDAEILNNDIL